MRLLLVDDDEGARALARAYAALAGCSDVVEAESGAEAVEIAAAGGCDAVVIDFHMPGMSGLEAARRILRDHPRLPLVAWTSCFDPEVERGFLEAGAVRHVPKTETEALRSELAGLCAEAAAA